MNCASCGAVLGPAALACPYCNAPTPAADEAHRREVAEADARAKLEAAAKWRAEAVARTELARVAKQSATWSVLGTFLCCLPLGVVGIVQGVKARALAAEARVPVPTSATAGIAVGVLSCVLSVGFVTWAALRSERLEDQARARITQLEGETRAGVTAASLDLRTACGLAEIYTLEHGYDRQTGHELSAFECAGKLAAGPDRAELDTFRFRYGSSTTYETTACFERGSKWFVKELRKDACPGVSASARPPPPPARPPPSSSGPR